MEALAAGFFSLPAPALYAASALIVVASAVVLRLLFNSLHGKTPPVFEGVPYIGGLLKFAAVCTKQKPWQRKLLKLTRPSQGPMNLMKDGYSLHGEVFTVPVAHKRMTFLLGVFGVSSWLNALPDP